MVRENRHLFITGQLSVASVAAFNPSRRSRSGFGQIRAEIATLDFYVSLGGERNGASHGRCVALAPYTSRSSASFAMHITQSVQLSQGNEGRRWCGGDFGVGKRCR
jgi:hypothetical protein